ncbi:MAG: EAL domain-containing protein [Burkholderiales bacterium]
MIPTKPDAPASIEPSGRRSLRRTRRHAIPLDQDTAPSAVPAAARPGLLAKLQILSVGMVIVTAAAITAFDYWHERASDETQLVAHARSIAAIVAPGRLHVGAMRSGDRIGLERLTANLGGDSSIAYAVVHDAAGRTQAERRFAPRLESAVVLPWAPDDLARDAVRTSRRMLAGETYLETMVPIRAGTSADAASGPALGYLRLGMSLEGPMSRLRGHTAGLLTVAGLLAAIALIVSMLVSRALVAPMRRLMRAARAVAAGRLDIVVPPRSRDELGLLTRAFNDMTRRLAESRAEIANVQRSLEDKVAQRTRELEVATAHAYKLAQHDILTGLPNRSLLNQRLRQILAQAQRDTMHVACLFLDFDHFKRINDTLGHDAGDQLLQSIAQRLTHAVREADVVARLGGDEFVLVLPGLDPAHATFEVMSVVNRVRESFLAPFRVTDQTPTLTCSIGVSLYPLDAQDPATLIKQADTAMYAAKDAGRNAYRFYTADMNARVRERLRIETDMRRGLLDDEFFLVYQPQLDLVSGRPYGVEALLRWRDPERGIVGPAEFIPIAEESGMIQVLGAKALRDACRQVARWHEDGLPLRLSVNLSVQQLQHDSWLTIVDDALATSGLAPSVLDLEITESVIITHPDRAVATLASLKDRGVSITVDDFGTGYSSLSYLARLPIHGLKIDQRFVRGIALNRNDEAITQAIIALARSLSLRCIAEGVETDEQAAFLKSHGCRHVQGFLVSGPLEAPELREWWFARSADRPPVSP